MIEVTNLDEPGKVTFTIEVADPDRPDGEIGVDAVVNCDGAGSASWSCSDCQGK